MSEHKLLRAVEVKNADRGEVTAIFSGFGVEDLDGDVTLPGAFPEGKVVPISAYNHDSWNGSLPVGKGTIRQTGTQAIVEAQLFMNTAGGRDTFVVLRELGDLAEFSFGFNVKKSRRDTVNGRPVRVLEQLDVFEVSPVLRGSGIGTGVLAMKSTQQLDAKSRAVLNEIADRLYVGEKLKAEYERFLRHQVQEIACRYHREVEIADRTAEFHEWFGGAYAYDDIPAESVAAPKRSLAATAAGLAADKLRVPAPEIRWFSQKVNTLYGRADRPMGVIWLRNDLDDGALMLTTVHEVRHLAPGGDEKAARAYEIQFLEELRR